ncbi:hypothetical protein LCGC14_3052650 [marine sediment metagenome]|uniref:YgiT-type zinc finger domain-containing protein n=1 Tax=marine sediment metagenome TaxID=412755 RepID=A0A0F8ZC22_9ZZZZ
MRGHEYKSGQEDVEIGGEMDITCPYCEEHTKAKMVSKYESYSAHGQVVVEAEVVVCSKCDNEIFDEELDGVTIDKVYQGTKQ